MSRGWNIALAVLGALWAFFLVAITITPQDALSHLAAWWDAIVSAWGIIVGVVAFGSMAAFAVTKPEKARNIFGTILKLLISVSLGVSAEFITRYFVEHALH